mgnify:FL=1
MGLATGQQQQIARPQGHVIALRRADPDLSFHQQVKRHHPGRALLVGQSETAAIEAAQVERALDAGLADQLVYLIHDSI